jgi:raffinose/stachyose/melibiose transport system substrate-binding protein
LAVRAGGQPAFDAAFNRTGSFADPAFVKAGELFKQLVDLNAFQDGFLGEDYNAEAAHMGNGEAAMELMGQWAPGVQKDQSKDKKGLPEGTLGWFPFPSVPDQKGDSSDVFGGGDGFAFGKNAPDATIEFAKSLFTRDNIATAVTTKGILPTVKGMDDLVTDPLLQTVLAARDNAKYYQLYYDQFLPPPVAQAVLDAVQGLSAGTMSPEEAAQAVEDVAAVELAPK